MPRAARRRLQDQVVACSILLILAFLSSINSAKADTLITDEFDLGIWSPLMTRVQKSVPVCIWDSYGELTAFNISVESAAFGASLRLRNEIDDGIPYRVHWLSGAGFNRRERLSPGIPSMRSYTSKDTVRCASGPTGLLRITINAKRLKNAPPGVYTDTLRLTVLPL